MSHEIHCLFIRKQTKNVRNNNFLFEEQQLKLVLEISIHNLAIFKCENALGLYEVADIITDY